MSRRRPEPSGFHSKACSSLNFPSFLRSTVGRNSRTRDDAAAKASPTKALVAEEYTCRELYACCDFSQGQVQVDATDSASCYAALPVYSPSIYPEAEAYGNTIDQEIDILSRELRVLSMKIHEHPELGFEEVYAHDALSSFMSSHGFTVTKHYLGLKTAWKAEFSHGHGGRTLGVNSEMDALRGLGHACGHNLIAMAGCAVALAVKASLVAHGISGKVILLGTPAEEGGGGKAILLDKGAYNDMDLCIMSHPAPGKPDTLGLASMLSMVHIEAEFFGHAAHAGAAPWEGTNALDAAFLAYSGISVLRQQMKPTHRVHGIVQGKDWSANVIPDYAKMIWIVRAPTYDEVKVLAARVENCIKGAALSASCKLKISRGIPYYDIRQNSALGNEILSVINSKYGWTKGGDESSASTDFGNVSYQLPSLHPAYAIPTIPGGGNHTAAFATAAATVEAHTAALTVAKALARTGLRAVSDDTFFAEVKRSFETLKT